MKNDKFNSANVRSKRGTVLFYSFGIALLALWAETASILSFAPPASAFADVLVWSLLLLGLFLIGAGLRRTLRLLKYKRAMRERSFSLWLSSKLFIVFNGDPSLYGQLSRKQKASLRRQFVRTVWRNRNRNHTLF